MAKQRASRKELTQPDQFITYSVQALQWLQQHTKVLVYSLSGLILGGGLLWGWSAWQAHREHTAEVRLYEAMKALQPASRTTADKDEANKDLTRLQALIDGYHNTPAAAHAYWHLGHIRFAQRAYSEALTAYEAAKETVPQAPRGIMATLVTLNLAYAQEAKQDWQGAKKSFETVLQSHEQWLRSEAYLGLGRCHEKNGALQEAITTYEKALADSEVHEAARQGLTERLALVKMEHESLHKKP